jgi:hypothetical protein
MYQLLHLNQVVKNVMEQELLVVNYSLELFTHAVDVILVLVIVKNALVLVHPTEEINHVIDVMLVRELLQIVAEVVAAVIVIDKIDNIDNMDNLCIHHDDYYDDCLLTLSSFYFTIFYIVFYYYIYNIVYNLSIYPVEYKNS